jgi:arabinose-5-phosphate isomerase
MTKQTEQPDQTPPHQSATAPAELIRIQARALLSLSLRLDDATGPMPAAFRRAVALLAVAADTRRPVTLLGIGKSGLIARKIAATLASTGTPAHFLHPAEAVHGDLGNLAPGDLVLALSSSGETEEITRLLPIFARLGVSLLSLCGNPASTLAQASTVFLDASVPQEACALNLAPTTSTTAMLALGDALAIETSRLRNFQPQHFAELHPGGRLGLSLTPVHALMHTGEAIPAVAPATPMSQVIYEMSRKKLGITTVLAPDRTLLGIISDGDLRRLLERSLPTQPVEQSPAEPTPNPLAHTAGEIMNPTPFTIDPAALATTALALMEARRITALIVTGPEGIALGVLHIHDLYNLFSPGPA